MEMTETKRGDIVVLSISGRVDASNAGSVEEKLLSLIARGDRRILVDGADLDYISSAGLRALLVAAKRLRNDGGRMGLCALQDYVKEILDMVNLTAVLEVYATQKDAIAQMR